MAGGHNEAQAEISAGPTSGDTHKQQKNLDPSQISSSAIEDYALIGDCHTAALVSKTGSIDWLCWPRFDSSACFAAIVGTPDNGCWQISPVEPVTRTSRRYIPETLILETVFETESGTVALTDFMAIEGQSVVRIVEGRSGSVKMSGELILRFGYGSAIPWVTRLKQGTGVRAIAGPDQVVLASDVKLHGKAMKTVADFTITANERKRFVLTYAASHLDPPVPPDADKARQDAENAWIGWSNRGTYRGRYKEQVNRSLLTLKALSYLPTGGIVAAPTTSLPEQANGSRNWDYRFCWLRDATFTLLALMHAGYREEARAWGAWLRRSIAGSPAQIQTLYGIGGERWVQEYNVPWLAGYQGSTPVRVGNAASSQLQLDIYGELVDALHQEAALGLVPPSATWDLQHALVSHLETIWQQPDESIWEVRGGAQNFTFSKVMAWVAVDRAIRGAETFGLHAPLARWQALRSHIHETICRYGFNIRRNSFVQTFGGDTLDASLLLLPMLGFLPPEDHRIRGTLEAIGRHLMVDGLVRRYVTHETADGLTGSEGVFLACSFWYVDNLHLQGRTAEARAMFDRLLSLCNDVGLLAEEYDPATSRQMGNFPQAFSHLALINTALNLDTTSGPAEQRSQGAEPDENTPEAA